MKKQIFALLLSAVILASGTACQNTSHENFDSVPTAYLEDDSQSSEPTPLNDVNKEYDEILHMYKKLLKLKSSNGELGDICSDDFQNISKEIFDKTYNIVNNSSPRTMGYATKDLNNDDIPELILLNNKNNIFAVFSSIKGTTLLIDIFEKNNHLGAIDINGTIYKSGYSKGDTWYAKITKITPTGQLEIFKYGCIDSNDYVNEKNEVQYYKVIEGQYYYIDKKEIDELESKYYSVFSDFQETTEQANLAFNYVLEYNPK